MMPREDDRELRKLELSGSLDSTLIEYNLVFPPSLNLNITIQSHSTEYYIFLVFLDSHSIQLIGVDSTRTRKRRTHKLLRANLRE